MTPPTLKILVLAHDLSDAAVQRRVSILQIGGAEVTIAGFRRTSTRIDHIEGYPTTDFGQTYAANFTQRIYAVLREVLFLKRHRALFSRADIIIARNLEMLAIAVRGQSICKDKPVIVYECLDIHRLLLGRGLISIALRAIEGWLSRRASALITSSPAFVDQYFNALSSVRLPIKMVENKVLVTNQNIPSHKSTKRPLGPPWIIGWFGIIRCRRSLQILSELVRRGAGKIEVDIRGRPAVNEFDDFYKQVKETPGISFLGPYKNPDDLAIIYESIHFTWAMDFFEEGQNSAWLLPNRLYEGGLYNSIPIALDNVETGRFLKNKGIGILTKEPIVDFLFNFFNDLKPTDFQTLESKGEKIPKIAWIYDNKECIDFILYLYSLSNKRRAVSGDN